MLGDPLQSRSNRRRGGGPHQKHRIDTIEARIRGLGESEISANHLDLWWEPSRARVARQRADLRDPVRQSRENLTADGASSSDNENMIHAHGISYSYKDTRSLR